MQVTVTVEIDTKRGRYWLRINKKDANNKQLIYDKGPSLIHEKEVSIDGSQIRFRLWWKSERSEPYLQALYKNDWSFNKAYYEIQRITGLPMVNPYRKPDRVIFDVRISGDEYVFLPKV